MSDKEIIDMIRSLAKKAGEISQGDDDKLYRIIRDIRILSRSSQVLECDSVAMILTNVPDIIMKENFWEIALGWIEQSSYRGDVAGTFAQWIILNKDRMLCRSDNDFIYYIELLIWMFHNEAIFSNNLNGISNMITSAMMFRDIKRYDLCMGTLSRLYDSLSEIDDEKYSSVLLAISNNKQFLMEISEKDADERLTEAARQLLQLVD